jgi:hypothetical protein
MFSNLIHSIASGVTLWIPVRNRGNSLFWILRHNLKIFLLVIGYLAIASR